MTASAAPRILVRAPNWAGDLVMSTPALRALRDRFPGSHIAVWVRSELAPLLAGCRWIDECIPLAREGGLRALWRAGRSVARRGRFDIGVCLPDSHSSALLMRIAGVRRVVGYRRGGRGWLLQAPVARERAWGRRGWVARERHGLGLVAALGGRDDDTRLQLWTTPEEEAEVDALLGGEAGRSWVVLAPGASYGASKCWPAEYFSALGDALAAEGHAVAIAGTAAEAGRVEAVRAGMRAPALALAGRLSLGGLKALLRRSRLLVCNDAGARHIAVSFGVPSVVFFGPTSVAKTNLNLERVRVLETDAACRPCYKRECPIDHRCLRGIAPDRALAAAREALAS